MEQDFPDKKLKSILPDLVVDGLDGSTQLQLPVDVGTESLPLVAIKQHAMTESPQISSTNALNSNFMEIILPTFVGLILTITTFFSNTVQWNMFSALGLLSVIVVIRFHQIVARLTKSSYPVSPKAACILQLLSMVIPILGLFLLPFWFQNMPGFAHATRHDSSALALPALPFLYPVVMPSFYIMFTWLQYVLYLCGKGSDKPGNQLSFTIIVTFLIAVASFNIHDVRQLLELGISTYFSVLYSVLLICTLILACKPLERLFQTANALQSEASKIRAKGSRYAQFWLGLYP